MSRKNAGPRRKRMKRINRLNLAKTWIQTYTGKNIIRGYRNWFVVDLICAIKELKILKVSLDQQYIEQALAGYTSGRAPYGITWEEYEKSEDCCNPL